MRNVIELFGAPLENCGAKFDVSSFTDMDALAQPSSVYRYCLRAVGPAPAAAPTLTLSSGGVSDPRGLEAWKAANRLEECATVKVEWFAHLSGIVRTQKGTPVVDTTVCARRASDVSSAYSGMAAITSGELRCEGDVSTISESSGYLTSAAAAGSHGARTCTFKIQPLDASSVVRI